MPGYSGLQNIEAEIANEQNNSPSGSNDLQKAEGKFIIMASKP